MAQADFQPTWALISRPPGYPTGPAVGKIQEIWQTNYQSLYRRLSPYSNYDPDSSINGIFNQEPFEYTYIDQGPNLQLENESVLMPVGSVQIDTDRITKFIASGRGTTFISLQKSLQQK